MEMKTVRQRQVAGFSMLEMVVVVFIILTVSAIAIPSVLRSVREYRLNATARDVANILQQTRFEAIRRNTIINCRIQPQGNTTVLWVDVNNNNALDPTERMLLLPVEVQFIAPNAAPGTGSMNFQNAQQPAGSIAFDARGTVNFGAGGAGVYVMFLGYPQEPTYGFKAVSVTPMGQTKVWGASAGGTWHSP